MRVLLADRTPESRLALEQALESLGHQCLVAEDGLRAWELLQDGGADVVISNWKMPGLDGADLCRRLRQDNRHGSYTYFVLLTTPDDRDAALSAAQAGADDCLTTPVERGELELRLTVASRVAALRRRLSHQQAELERLHKRIHEDTRRDPLTRVGNRLCLREDLDTLSGRVDRYGHSYCVALCDVDLFRSYNDAFGFQAGDEALCAVCDALVSQCRVGDSVYRYGDEELLVLLPEQNLESAAVAAERMRKAVEQLAIPHPGNPLGIVTISVGVAGLGPRDALLDVPEPTDLLRQADAALYRAKKSGRNCAVCHHEARMAAS